MVDLKQVAKWFEKKGLWEKPFNLWSCEEIIELCEVIYSSPSKDIPPDGWTEPKVIDGELFLPFTVHPRFRWWNHDGQSICQTLKEIGAPSEVIEKYRPIGYDSEAIHH
jgi:hypothetical protein